jgi:transcriptional regulator with XRE-family HTH domain
MENQEYNVGHPIGWSGPMPKKKSDALEGFGARLAQLRKAAGYTQAELAQELGTSQRMIAYYESPEALPPSALLPQMAKMLGVTTDVLLGIAPMKKTLKPRNNRLHRRLQQVEQLDPAEKRQVLQLLDAFIERGQLKKKTGMG